MKPMQIFPAILTDSMSVAQEQLDLAADSGVMETVQIDVIDGLLADNITVAPLDLSVLNFHDLKCDLHLMVDEPMDFVFETEAVREHLPIRAIIAQVEHMSYQSSFLEEVRKQNWKRGLSLDIFTPLETIEPESWEQLDIIQLMGNEMGVQGLELHEHFWSKLQETAEYIKKYGYETEIYIDIGVREDNLLKLKEAGVAGAMVGSAFWTAEDPLKVMAEFATLSSN
jgi:ribulose-phosphate 3-epimerase